MRGLALEPELVSGTLKERGQPRWRKPASYPQISQTRHRAPVFLFERRHDPYCPPYLIWDYSLCDGELRAMDPTVASKKFTTTSGWLVLWIMIRDTSIWRLGCSNRWKISSAQKCYPCSRYILLELDRGSPYLGSGRTTDQT